MEHEAGIGQRGLRSKRSWDASNPLVCISDQSAGIGPAWAWFSAMLGYQQPMRIQGAPVPLDPAKPAMLTLSIGFPQPGQPIGVQTVAGRTRLFNITYGDLERLIRAQLQQMFGDEGFEAKRDIAGIILNRWGHAYIAPQPGFYFAQPGSPAPHAVIRRRYGRIAFGHSELSGRQSWGRAAQESRRALSQILEVLV